MSPIIYTQQGISRGQQENQGFAKMLTSGGQATIRVEKHQPSRAEIKMKRLTSQNKQENYLDLYKEKRG
jgi:hypothetical protein